MKRLAIFLLTLAMVPGSALAKGKKEAATKEVVVKYAKKATDSVSSVATSCWEGTKKRPYTVGSVAASALLIGVFYKYCPLAKDLCPMGCCKSAPVAAAEQN